MNFKGILVAAALAVTAPFAASAALVDVCDASGSVLGGPYDVNTLDLYNCDFTTTDANGSVVIDFLATTVPTTAMAANIQLSLVGSYTSAVLEWFETGGISLGSLNVPINTLAMLPTIFAGPAPDAQTLVFTWTGYSGAGLDINIQVAAVPLPAGILLMGTALAGFGVLRRKAKKAA